MGFNKDRGDSLNVTNSNFTVPTKEVIPEEPFWKPYANIETAKSAGQYLLSFIAMLYLFFKFLKPMLKKLTDPPLPSAAERYNKNETTISVFHRYHTLHIWWTKLDVRHHVGPCSSTGGRARRQRCLSSKWNSFFWHCS